MNILRKLTSRKFLMALTAVISGIITAIAGGGDEVSTIVGSAMTITATVVYCIMEGVVDAKSVHKVADAAVDIAEELGASDEAMNAMSEIASAAEVLIGSGGDSIVKGE